MDQEAMIGRIASWASADENVRAVVVTGSAARGDGDAWSDVDAELYVRDPGALLGRREWYGEFGDLLAVEELPNPGGIPTRLLYLIDGKIDFTVGRLADFGSRAYDRAFRIVLDKDGRAAEVTTTTTGGAPPTETEYAECVNWFAAAALMEAKLIVRDEPWAAKYRDWDLKQQLLRIIAWDHCCRYGWDYDTWYAGRHINEWADDDIREALAACWSGYDTTAMMPALRTSMALFELLADRTARTLGLRPFHHNRIRAEITRILDQVELR